MGDLQTNENGVIAGIEHVLKSRFGINNNIDNQRAPFVRVFPPKGNGSATFATIQGNSWQALSSLGGQAPGTKVDTGVQCFTIALDPEYTAANAVIFVTFGDSSQWIAMRPGETYDVPGGFTSFKAWHGFKGVADLITGPPFAPYGGVSWICGTVLGSRADFKQTKSSRGGPNTIAGGFLTTSFTQPSESSGAIDALSFAVITSGLKGIRLSFFAQDATGPIVNPADLAAVVRPWVLVRVNNTIGATGGAVDGITNTSDNPGKVAWCPQSDNDLTITQFQRTFDREIVAGTLAMTLELKSLAGAGPVTSLMAIVDGY